MHGNLEDAEARRAQLRIRKQQGARIEPTRQTFEQYAREWLERQTLRPRTLEIYSWALNQHLIPYFGRRRLDQITAEEIAAFVAQMKRKKLKGWTITSALRPLSIILAQAAAKAASQSTRSASSNAESDPATTINDPSGSSPSTRCTPSSPT